MIPKFHNCSELYSSKKSDWTTPDWLFNLLDEEFAFTLDPCATKQNAKCKKFFTEKENGLKQDWSKDIVFMNPPYGSQISEWIYKAKEEGERGAVVVCLIPARPDTTYWHETIFPFASSVCFVRGRVGFGQTKICPFPSAIIIFGKTKWKKLEYKIHAKTEREKYENT